MCIWFNLAWESQRLCYSLTDCIKPCFLKQYQETFEIKIIRRPNVIVLSQFHYINNKDDNQLSRTSLDTNVPLSKNRSEFIFQAEYAKVTRNLMYLISCTRSDITYTVSKISRYSSNLDYNYWKAIVSEGNEILNVYS